MAQAQARSRPFPLPDDLTGLLDMARNANWWEHLHIVEAIPHLGRIVVFLSNGAAFERATDGSWSRHEVAEGTIPDNGYDSMRAASIPIG